MLRALSITLGLALTTGAAAAQDMALPPLKVQPNAQLVVDEHLDALNKCDWGRLMAQYPPEVQFHLPNGVFMEGRRKIGDLFAGFCKERKDGGLKGLVFRPVKVFTVGETVNVTWEADAPYLSEPYKGADAYVTKDGLMYAQVTTFDTAGMKFK